MSNTTNRRKLALIFTQFALPTTLGIMNATGAKKQFARTYRGTLRLGWQLTVEVEAKAKELAVVRLLSELKMNH